MFVCVCIRGWSGKAALRGVHRSAALRSRLSSISLYWIRLLQNRLYSRPVQKRVPPVRTGFTCTRRPSFRAHTWRSLPLTASSATGRGQRSGYLLPWTRRLSDRRISSPSTRSNVSEPCLIEELEKRLCLVLLSCFQLQIFNKKNVNYMTGAG